MLIKTEIYTDENGVERKKDYFGYIDENGNEVITSTWDRPAVEPEPIEPEPTQLDRIEAIVSQTKEEIAQEARDEYTLELIENGVI